MEYLTNGELRTILRLRRLSTSGKRSELIQKIKDSANPEIPEDKYITITGNKDADTALFISADYDVLLALCNIDYYTSELCKSDYIWKERIKAEHGVDIGKYRGKYTYREIYEQLHGLEPRHKFEYAINNNLVPLVKQLLNTGIVATTYDLEAAVAYNNTEVAKILLNAGIKPNFSDDLHRSLLVYAIDLDNLEMVKLLIDYGANVNKPYKYHLTTSTPIIEALKKYRAIPSEELESIINYLLDNGAKISREDIDHYNLRDELRALGY